MTSPSSTDPGAALTEDLFLGGRVRLRQPRDGFRGGIDAVLLAAAVPARPGEAVLDLGCGVGTALFCLAARVPGLTLWGLELQEEYAALARLNGAANAMPCTILEGDLAAPPAALRAQSFDHVLANPPYFAAGARQGAADSGRERARAAAAPVVSWIDAATRRLKPGGTLTLIQRIERLPECLAACDARLGAVTVLPLEPRAGRPARLFLLRATKGRRAPFVLQPPVLLHAGPRHDGDRDSYTPLIAAVLREAAALPWSPAPPDAACNGRVTAR